MKVLISNLKMCTNTEINSASSSDAKLSCRLVTKDIVREIDEIIKVLQMAAHEDDFSAASNGLHKVLVSSSHFTIILAPPTHEKRHKYGSSVFQETRDYAGNPLLKPLLSTFAISLGFP